MLSFSPLINHVPNDVTLLHCHVTFSLPQIIYLIILYYYFISLDIWICECIPSLQHVARMLYKEGVELECRGAGCTDHNTLQAHPAHAVEGDTVRGCSSCEE